jgi:phospholipid/cholesterol/gamma-HCH transport system permease protein
LSPAPPPVGFAVEFLETSAGQGQLRLGGALRMAEAAPLWERLRLLEGRAIRGGTLDLDMSGVERVDGGAMALLACLRTALVGRGVKSEFVAADERVQRLIHLYGGDLAVDPLQPRRPLGTLDQLGRATWAVLQEGQLVLAFAGQMVVSGLAVLRAPRSANWREVPSTMERAGADAVPVVVLSSFLVGLATAFQAALQLRRFGASLLVADLIGLSICRELGPLMTAIVLVGRSGASFAAELGFMQVNGEVDALRTMGLDPMRFTVLPRALALLAVLPLLVLLADVAGLAGGLLVGVLSLDLTVQGYLAETARAVHAWDVVSGLVKSVVFALLIGLIACQQGLATSGGAEGVGRRTTSAVVTALFSVILADAALTIAFAVAGR